jgi:hypothetical protein
VSEAVRGLPRPGAPIDLPERVLARLRTRTPQPRTASESVTKPEKRWRRRWLVGGATAAAGVMAAAFFLNGDRPGMGPDVAMDARGPAFREAAPAMAPRSGLAPTAMLGAATGRRDGGTATEADSLRDLVATLQRQPKELDVLRVLQEHRNEIEVVEFSVVDTLPMGEYTRTLLVKNGLDVVDVVEVETPVTSRATGSNAGNRSFAVYVEGENSRIEQTLDELQQKAPAVDYGVLGDVPELATGAVSLAAEGGGEAVTEGADVKLVDDQGREEASPPLVTDQTPPAPVAEAVKGVENTPSLANAVETKEAVPEQVMAKAAEAPAADGVAAAYSNSSLMIPEGTTRKLQQVMQNRAGYRQQYSSMNRGRATTRAKIDAVDAPAAAPVAEANRRMLLIFQAVSEGAPSVALPAAAAEIPAAAPPAVERPAKEPAKD